VRRLVDELLWARGEPLSFELQLLALLGLHGSLTPEESAVPLFHVAARDNT
jgi:hypothetical protein